MSECAECTQLESDKEAAHKAGDKSKVTDCVVLIARHPNHGKQISRVGSERTEG